MATFKVTIEGDPATNVFFVVNERELPTRDGKVELEVPEGELQRLRFAFLGMPSMPYTVTVGAEEGAKVTTFDKDGKEVPAQPIKSKIPSNRITGVGLFRFIVRGGA
jgi:hypothetical protein